jgi:hypothetical protein
VALEHKEWMHVVMADDFQTKIQDGYVFSLQGYAAEAFNVWHEVFLGVLDHCEKKQFKTIEELDQNLNADDHISSWLRDFQGELFRFGALNNENHKKILQICTSYLEYFGQSLDWEATKEVYKVNAQVRFALGEREKADQLFMEWLKKDTKWLDGWLAWADCWLQNGDGFKNDFSKALQILNMALKYNQDQANVALYDRLTLLYEKLGDQDRVQWAKGKSIDIRMEENMSGMELYV